MFYASTSVEKRKSKLFLISYFNLYIKKKKSMFLKCHLVVFIFDKLEYEIRNKVLIFVSIMKLEHKT